MKIVLTGGGTLGSVSPLIAIWQSLLLKKGEPQVLFIGTKHGPEKEFLLQYPSIKFNYIPVGKLRRYFSWQNLLTPFFLLAAFLKSYFILSQFKPDVIISAGGFVAVPVIWAGKILKIKIMIHQLDLEPTLSNILVKKIADTITVTFAKSLADFKNQNPVLVGSLIREEVALTNNIVKNNRPTVLFLGGGTGAAALNELSVKTTTILNQIEFWQVTGKNKFNPEANQLDNFLAFEFLNQDYYSRLKQADLIISRAGLSTLMELSYLGKPTIIIPIPASQQVENAVYFSDRGAAVYLNQDGLTPELLADKIKALINNQVELDKLSDKIEKIMMHGGEQKIADLI
ncbi:MAG: UDP-N-acetylglucosamine--N-acetylmuramyl-(pentapeptide) pyrophosphoryl-undecaprenol N-acetylglucosamine transferase [Patescibacteria group bacterium]|jgi:UDP-N-acetylglucosamine--N-acetylmuramyl-(pentapeptide) pyrophosphoryl-undecaprenol N-acetylglucosamine transferase